MTYDNISIEQYVGLTNAAEEHEKPLFKGLAKIAFLTGYTVEELFRMPLEQYGKIASVYWFLEEDPQMQIVSKWQGCKIECDPLKHSLGDFADIQTLNKDNDKLQNLHKLCAKFWMNEKMTFDERAEYCLKNMPIPIAMGISGFFLLHSQNLQSLLVRYLNRKLKRMRKQLEMTS